MAISTLIRNSLTLVVVTPTISSMAPNTISTSANPLQSRSKTWVILSTLCVALIFEQGLDVSMITKLVVFDPILIVLDNAAIAAFVALFYGLCLHFCGHHGIGLIYWFFWLLVLLIGGNICSSCDFFL